MILLRSQNKLEHRGHRASQRTQRTTAARSHRMYRLFLDCDWPGEIRNPSEDAKRAVTLAARARRRRLPAWPEVIPGEPCPRPRKRGTGAPGMQPALTEQTPM